MLQAQQTRWCGRLPEYLRTIASGHPKTILISNSRSQAVAFRGKFSALRAVLTIGDDTSKWIAMLERFPRSLRTYSSLPSWSAVSWQSRRILWSKPGR
jgi:hypothetical protein